MKLTLLFIPLIFLSSCNINTNNYYDNLQQKCLSSLNKSECLESVEIMRKNGYKEAEYSESRGYICPAGMNANGFRGIGEFWWCEPIQNKFNSTEIRKENGTGIIKDFGSGFTLHQTDDETLLSYSGKTIKTWSHTPPQEVPFIWDEACTIVWKGFEKLTPENQSTGKQGVWDRLTEKEKKECMKENYGNGSIYILQNNNSRFFIITESYYERANQWVFDTVSGNLQSFGFTLIESIQDTGTEIEILANGRKIYTPDFSKEITPKN